MIKSINIESNTFDNLVKEKNLEIENYDHWVIDMYKVLNYFFKRVLKNL